MISKTAAARHSAPGDRHASPVAKAEFIPHDEFSAHLPILSEAVSLLELVQLQLSPVYLGYGVPRGDGSPVVLIPGLLGVDLGLFHLHTWFTLLGYRPYFSGMGVALDCPDLLARRLATTITRAHRESGRRVHLVGHSLGGIFARSAAVRMPDHVASVTTLGSPFRGLIMHPAVLRLSNFLRRQVRLRYPMLPGGCGTSRCTCAFGRSLRRRWPRHVRQTAIYTRTDGIVDWRYCLTGESECDIEVAGTHVGLIVNSCVYRHLAHRMARG
jgi:triacylglycerol lipase